MHFFYDLFKDTSATKSLLLPILLLFILVSPLALAQPQAELTANRLSGPAPLAVMFDATGTTHINGSIDTYRQLGYYFNFDDPGAGTWATTGLSKNSETGAPLAAHVFHSPGEYQVGVRAQDSSGLWSDAWITVAVADPNTVYAGDKTVVISMGSDFTGAPSGASETSNAWPTFESGKRYLLRAGEDFSALGELRLEDVSDFQIGSFGAGAKPIVSAVLITMDEDNAATPPQRGVVQGLDTLSIQQNKIFHDLLVYNNSLSGTGAVISNAGAIDWYPLNQIGSSTFADWEWCRGYFVVENTVDMNNTGVDKQNPLQGGGKWVAFMGNQSTNAGEHTLRLYYSYKSLIGHNVLTGINPTGGRHALKIHARGIAPWNDALFPNGDANIHNGRSRYLRVNNNLLGDTTSLNAWTMQVAPQDDGNSNTVEGLQDIVIEGNEFVTSGATQADLQTLGSRITERGSARNMGVQVWDTHPSNYPNDESWHGPYYIDDAVPETSAPASGSGAPAGQLDFEFASRQVNENTGSLEVDILRTGGSAGNVSVDYALQAGSAEATSDYVDSGGVISFLAGETSYSLFIDIIDDAVSELDENFSILLSNPTGGVNVGLGELVVTIIDEDAEEPEPSSQEPSSQAPSNEEPSSQEPEPESSASSSSGGGCTLGKPGAVDPTLPGLLAISMFWAFRRRKQGE